MTAPAFLYSALLATMIGSLFHFWKGGSGGRLVMMLILSWIGFILGALIANTANIPFLMIGPISGGFGSLGSLLLLIVGDWFSRLDQP